MFTIPYLLQQMPEPGLGGYLTSLLQEFHKKGNYLWQLNSPIHGHMHVCSGRKSDSEVPSTGCKTQLLNASLVEKKITFEKKSTCSYFHEKLLESFPKLKEGGGYEPMRKQQVGTLVTSKLELFQPKGNAGYVLDLKEMVASARIYV